MRIVYIFEHEYRIIKNLICNEEFFISFPRSVMIGICMCVGNIVTMMMMIFCNEISSTEMI